MPLAPHQQIQILHVDDEADFADLTETFLERKNDQFAVETATSADEGLETISDRPPDCVISDYNMPGMDGIEFLQAVRKEYPDLPFILYTGKGSEEVASDAIAADVTDYLQKGSGSEQYELLANRILNAVKQQRAEECLRETQREYATVFENAQNGLLLVDVGDDGFRYQQCNPQAVELIGRDKTEIVGKSPYEALGPENGKEVVNAYRRCIEQGNPVEYTVTLNLPMGQVIRECEVNSVAANGEVEQLVVAFQDITERHERQQELRRNERAMDEAPVGITITDPDQEDNPIIYANSGFRSLTGYANAEILGHNCRFLQGEGTSPESIATMREAIDSEERTTVQVRNYRKDGTKFWNRVSIAPVRDDEGSVVNFVGFQHDITDHKQRELELERTRDLLDQTERIADVGGWEIDTETMDVFWTENLFKLLGVDYDEEPPLDEALDIYHEDDKPIVENAVETALNAGESFDVEVRFHRPDGELRWLRVQGNPKIDSGSVVTLRGTVQDITDQKQMERDLRQERNLVTGIVETNPVGIAVVNAEGDLSFANDRAETIYRRSREEIGEMSHDDPEWDLVNEHGDPLEAGDAPFDRVVSRETTIRDHVVGIRRPSGERVWLSVNGAPQWNADGEFERAVFAFEDITEQVELETELDEILGRVSDAFLALDDELRFTHVNGQAEELLEASEEQLLGETLWDMYPEAAQADEIWGSFQKAMDTQDPQSYELYYEPLEFWVETTVYPSESGVSVYFQDVTERKEREQELEREKHRFQTIFEQSNDAIFLLDPENNAIEEVNPQAEELLGYTREEFVSSVAISDVHPEKTDQYRAFLDSVQADGSGRTDRFACVSKGGDKRYCEISASSLDIETSQLLIANVRDITEREEYKQRLENQNERLEEFASVVSHDLRNPLSVAQGQLELVREDCDSGQFDPIERAHNRMERLIEDLLTLAREGNVVTDTESVELSEIAANCWANVKTDNASIVIDTNQTILADNSRLKQVFENLMRNAIEHGDDTVTITIGGLIDGFYIEDDGSGIPPSDRSDVFEAGYSTNSDGTGFGLRITKQIIEAHGWTVNLTEGTEGGARFEITACEFAAD